MKQQRVNISDDPGPNRPLFHPVERSKRLSVIKISQDFKIWLAARPFSAPRNVVSSYRWLRHAAWSINRLIMISPFGFAYTMHPNVVTLRYVRDGKGEAGDRDPILSPPFAGDRTRFEP
jgi:hypothetical protein